MTTKRSATVSMSDVARQAGVSQSTVSRVLNNHPGISSATRETVLTTLRDLGYKADFFQLLNPEKSDRGAVVLALCPLPEQKDPLALEYFSVLVEGVKSALTEQAVALQIQVLPPDAADLTLDTEVRGVILVAYPSPALRAALRARAVPYVIVSGDLYSSSEDLVTVNSFEAAMESCEYLLGLGVRRFGFLLTANNAMLYDGFVATLRRHGLTVRPDDLRMVQDTDLPTFIEAIHHWIAEKDLPEAMVVSYREVANVIETMLKLNGIRQPESIRLLAFDHRPGSPANFLCLQSAPRQLGRRGAQRILEKIRAPQEPPYQIVIPMQLEGRESEKK